MKLPKLPRSGSKSSSSAHGSPVMSPIAQSFAVFDSPSALSPMSPSNSKPANKSLFAEKRKSLQLRLPSLSRSRSRGSKRDLMVSEASPKLVPSPLGRSNPKANMHAQSLIIEAAGASNSSRETKEPLVEELKRVFEKFDSNGDGKISAEELQCVLTALGDKTTREEAELMVAEADTDRDGFIDLDEFIHLNTRGSGSNGESLSTDGIMTDELADAFNMFDLDKNGCITPDELHCVLNNLGNHTPTLEECKRMIGGVDRKGCGYVDFDDFKKMMTSTTILA